jgi:hypothetical protein
MKVKLLKRIRETGRNAISINSYTTTTSLSGEYVTGMSYSYTGDEYSGLWHFGMSSYELREAALKVYLGTGVLDRYWKPKYKKYTRKWKLGHRHWWNNIFN